MSLSTWQVLNKSHSVVDGKPHGGRGSQMALVVSIRLLPQGGCKMWFSSGQKDPLEREVNGF